LLFVFFQAEDGIRDLVRSRGLGDVYKRQIVMIVVFICGFFIDFIEIIFIFVPVVTPIFDIYEVDMLWVGILMAINLQTSFLTPPCGFS